MIMSRESGFTENQLKLLEEAIAQGVTNVNYGDRSVSYRSVSEMLQIRSLIIRQLDPTRTHSQVMVFDKGFN